MIKISGPGTEVLNNEGLHPDTTFHVFCDQGSNGCKCTDKANCQHFQDKVAVRTKYTGSSGIGGSVAPFCLEYFLALLSGNIVMQGKEDWYSTLVWICGNRAGIIILTFIKLGL